MIPSSDRDPAFYIAGPMRGIPQYNFPAFFLAETRLREALFQRGVVSRPDEATIYNPAQHDLEYRLVDPYSESFERGDEILVPEGSARWDFEAILDSSHLVLLPGWGGSRGATTEFEMARMLGLTVWLIEPESGQISLLPANPEEAAMMVYDPAWIDPTEHSRASCGFYGECAFGSPEEAIEPEVERRSGDEVIVTDPVTGGAKGQKLARWDLLPPDALDHLARHFGKGAAKYEDRNWERGYDWGLSYAAMMRHAQQFWAGEDIDPETGSLHLSAVAFHALALTAFLLRGIGTDSRSKVAL